MAQRVGTHAFWPDRRSRALAEKRFAFLLPLEREDEMGGRRDKRFLARERATNAWWLP